MSGIKWSFILNCMTMEHFNKHSTHNRRCFSECCHKVLPSVNHFLLFFIMIIVRLMHIIQANFLFKNSNHSFVFNFKPRLLSFKFFLSFSCFLSLLDNKRTFLGIHTHHACTSDFGIGAHHWATADYRAMAGQCVWLFNLLIWRRVLAAY